ncbi:acyl-CoA dehydrogenase family protein [Nocardioides jishulii]|uniref:Acyl-CoA dehydrogenase n=1 Tax=Nocardioides jishulii TaxID=2575440 RepID=A0A4U2YN86_9ACTN|nr:acyl-CoA dehydrogenase family protein [Nocardioides jishulii]QCX27653.1 acyl-CoA dehydrogenase [Nocardioides jishulii]TKI62460.1 acyl-CoA dehydrogenase [Nocardioides jishulii]
MDFTLDDEQIALREAVRGLLSRRYGDFEERRRSVASEPGYDPTMWKALAEMGALGLPFTEEDGGMGAGPVEVGVVAQEIGRVLAPEPYLSTVVLAGGMVAALGTDVQRAEVLGPLSSGDLHLALAHAEPGGRWSDGATSVTASLVGNEWRLTGVKEPVLNGDAETLVVTAALPEGGTGGFLVAGEAAMRTSATAYDGTRVSRVVLDGALGVPLGEADSDASQAIGAALDRARIIACHEALGGMEAALKATTGYLRSRKQFGVPLSTFQALTFRAADMYVAVELSTSMVWWATMVASERDASATREAAERAALQVSRAGRLVGQEAIQLHGGIGMTAEYPVGNITAHLTALDHLLGDGGHHLRSLSQRLEGYGAIDPLA